MTKAMFGLVFAALTGCVFVPKTTSTTTVLSHTEMEVAGSVGGLEVRATANASTVRVESVHLRRCQRRVAETIQTTTGLHADLDTDGADGFTRQLGGLVVLAAIEPAAFVVSGLITGIAVNVSHDDVRKDEVEHVVAAYDCPLRAPRVAIEMVLPSGARLAATTDDAGRSTIEIPADEPARGKVMLVAGSARTVVAYAAKRGATTPAAAFSPPGMTGAGATAELHTAPRAEDNLDSAARALANTGRGVLRACGSAKGVTGVVYAQLDVDDDGRVHASLDRDDTALTECTTRLLSSLRLAEGHARTVMFPITL